MLDILITNVRYTNYKCNTINAKSSNIIGVLVV